MDYSLTVKLLEDILGTPNEIWKNYYIRFLNSRKQTSKQEVHHIIPVSLLEKDSYLIKDPCNLISLTFREHFIAHLILYKMYPNCRKLVAAAYFMGVLKSDYFKTSKQFAELRKTFQEKQRDFTLSTIDSYKGKIADSVKALWTSREYAEHMKEHLKELHKRPDLKQLISQGILEKDSPENRIKRAKNARQIQLQNPNWSKTHSEKVKAAFASEEKRQHQREMTLKSLKDPTVQKNKRIGYLKVKLSWIEKALIKNPEEKKLQELLTKKNFILEELNSLK